MLVKTQHNLQAKETAAHGVVIEDDLSNPIFVAVHLADGIMYSAVGDVDFKDALALAGVPNAPIVREIPPLKK
jgi:hypothetical protein